MKELLKKFVLLVLPDYQLNRVYRLDLDGACTAPTSSLPARAVIASIDSADAIRRSSDQRMRDHAWYAGDHAYGYGIWEDGDLVCMTWFWTAGHASMPERFADLRSDEAVMVDLLTAPRCRGKGYALAVTHHAAADLAARGYRRLWTWVWRNNWPSIATFTKAGWTYAFFLAECRLACTRRRLRLKFPATRPQGQRH